MTKQLATGSHPDILADRDQVRTGIIDKDGTGYLGSLPHMHPTQPMDECRDMCRESDGGDNGPETDPDALDDGPDCPVIVCHDYLCWKSIILRSRIFPLQKQFAFLSTSPGFPSISSSINRTNTLLRLSDVVFQKRAGVWSTA